MAHIKCRYFRPRCNSDWSDDNYCHQYLDMYGSTTGFCELLSSVFGKDADVDEGCNFYQNEEVIFEKNVASYTLDAEGLSIRGMFIDRDDIYYLSIDGEVFEDETEEEC